MPAPKKKPIRFQFSLRAVLLTFVVVASSFGLAKEIGIALAAFVIYCSIAIRLNGIKTRFDVFAVIVMSLLLLGLSFPDSMECHRKHRLTKSHHDFTKITQAVNSYHDTYGRFPSASVPDAKGRPAHSWRVLILPFLGYEDLYQKYDFNEPWDGPNNSLLNSELPLEYGGFTNYVALVGNDTVFRTNKSLRRNEIVDSTANTIMLVEISRKNDIHWMEPIDFPVEKAILPSPEDQPVNTTSNTLTLKPTHSGCFHVAMADGSVSCLRTDIPQSAFDALATANGGELVALKQLTKTEPSDWAKPVSLVIFVVSSVTMFYGAHRAFLKQD